MGFVSTWIFALSFSFLAAELLLPIYDAEAQQHLMAQRSAIAADSNQPWQGEWEKTVAAAHREGQVTVYGQARHPTSAAIEAFKDFYPKIQFNFISGSGSQLGVRVMAEKRAGKHLVDVAIGGPGTMVAVYYRGGLLDPLSSAFILPEVADPSAWWEKKHHYADPEGRYVMVMRGDISATMGAYNTRLVKPGEVQSWRDLLQPKWKGKIVMTDPRSAGNILNWRFLYYSPELGPEFIRRLLSEMEVRLSSDERQMMDWLGSGKHAIHLFAKGDNIEKAKAQGLPVEELLSRKETRGFTTGSGHICLFKNAPHPHAAKVYVNWLLSREGQLTWQNITKNNSLRMDIPKEMVPKESLPQEGKKYLMMDLPEYEDIRPLRKLVEEVLASKLK